VCFMYVYMPVYVRVCVRVCVLVCMCVLPPGTAMQKSTYFFDPWAAFRSRVYRSHSLAFVSWFVTLSWGPHEKEVRHWKSLPTVIKV